MIDWNQLTRKDMNNVSKVVKKARKLLVDIALPPQIEMDLHAAILGGCKMDFVKFLGFDKFNLLHDLFGIHANVNHDTGKLDNCFLPRCAR